MKENKFILLCIALVVIIYIVFYPSFFANVDEHNYLRNSWKLANGVNLTEVDASQALGGFGNASAEYVSKYNLGNSIWLLPGTILGMNGIFTWSLLTYLLIILTCYLILKKLQLPRHWLLLLIFFPPLLFYSRTILSELPAALFFTLSYYAYLNLNQGKRYWLLLGASLGFLTLIRYNFAVWAVIVVASLLLTNRKQLLKQEKIVKFAYLLVSALPWLILFVLINLSLYGSPFSSCYKFSGEEVIDLNLIPQRLPWYLLMLNLVYPLQFVALDLSKLPLKKALLIFVIFLVVFYSAAGGFLFEGKFTDPIVGIRFLFPVMPVVLVHYFSVLTRVSRKIILIFAVVVLSILAVALSLQHQQFLNSRRQIFAEINTLQQENASSLFVGDEDDFIYLGEQFSANFNSSGYSNIREFQLTDLQKWGKVFLLELDYPNRPDRPSIEMLKSIASYQQQGKLKLISSGESFNIYEFSRD